jgi:hypothetical protein
MGQDWGLGGATATSSSSASRSAKRRRRTGLALLPEVSARATRYPSRRVGWVGEEQVEQDGGGPRRWGPRRRVRISVLAKARRSMLEEGMV